MVRAPRLAGCAVMRADALRRGWRALPFGTVDDVTGPGITLVLAPHPDDESLGCGGLIAECCQTGRPPIVVVLTDGGMSHQSKAYPRERLVGLREAEARDAASVLGLPQDRLVFLREPDTNAPRAGAAFERVVRRLIDIVERFKCSSILAPSRFDPHCDHEAASLIAAEVAMRLRVRHMAYPVWGWTLPPDHVVEAGTPSGWRLDIACHLPRKLKAIAAHRSQYGELINDDPSGFRLPMGLLKAFKHNFETFLVP